MILPTDFNLHSYNSRCLAMIKQLIFTIITSLILSMPTFANSSLTGKYGKCGEFSSSAFEGIGLSITEKSISFLGYEWSCDLVNPVKVRNMENTYLYDAICSADGSTFEERMLIAPQKNDTKVLLLRNGDYEVMEKCD